MHLVDRAADRRVEPVVEPDLDLSTAPLSNLREPLDLRSADSARLLDQHVSAAPERPLGELGETVVRRRDNDGVRLEREQLLEIAAYLPPEARCEGGGSRAVRVQTPHELIDVAQGFRALSADEPAAHDRDAQSQI